MRQLTYKNGILHIFNGGSQGIFAGQLNDDHTLTVDPSFTEEEIFSKDQRRARLAKTSLLTLIRWADFSLDMTIKLPETKVSAKEDICIKKYIKNYILKPTPYLLDNIFASLFNGFTENRKDKIDPFELGIQYTETTMLSNRVMTTKENEQAVAIKCISRTDKNDMTGISDIEIHINTSTIIYSYGNTNSYIELFWQLMSHSFKASNSDPILYTIKSNLIEAIESNILNLKSTNTSHELTTQGTQQIKAA